jgi:hypothetical protein
LPYFSLNTVIPAKAGIHFEHLNFGHLDLPVLECRSRGSSLFRASYLEFVQNILAVFCTPCYYYQKSGYKKGYGENKCGGKLSKGIWTGVEILGYVLKIKISQCDICSSIVCIISS